MKEKTNRMTPDEVKEHWDYIQRIAKEYDTWPDWKKKALSVNYRTAAAKKSK
jgi:hypothetical protein